MTIAAMAAPTEIETPAKELKTILNEQFDSIEYDHAHIQLIGMNGTVYNKTIAYSQFDANAPIDFIGSNGSHYGVRFFSDRHYNVTVKSSTLTYQPCNIPQGGGSRFAVTFRETDEKTLEYGVAMKVLNNVMCRSIYTTYA
jgi:hypothetical protein